MARKRARYAQRTEGQRLHDAHQKRISGGSFLQHLGGASPATDARDAETRRAWQPQQENANAATEAAALQAMHEETTRLAAVRDAETRRAWQQQQA
ncbi:unnamed protein product, partial [Ascophyllum nodosum]